MSTVNEIRKANIRFWADKIGRQTLADKLGYKDTIYINQLCGGHGSFGGRTARKIEQALDLPVGWFDQPHNADSPDRLSAIIGKISDWDDRLLAEVEAQVELIRRRMSGKL